LKKYKKVLHCRDNGGSNAGHTVEVGDVKIALHQLGAGVMQKGCTAILGKEMVLHPDDLVLEIGEVLRAAKSKTIPAHLKIDEMAGLCLDTHRAFEAVLKMRSSGSKGATGRGIAPAYADVIYRHPLRMRDLMAKDWRKKLGSHYQFYTDLVSGFGFSLAELEVPRLDGTILQVGSEGEFLTRLMKAKKILGSYVGPVHNLVAKIWQSEMPVVFEKAQALGLDKRWGVYPDVTASNCSFDGILSSTEGEVIPTEISARVATIKATYSSSVGSRKLPTLVTGKLAKKIREDAHEYGATTKRPRDIAQIDLPMMDFLFKTSGVEQVAITHLDIAYPNEPIKICVGYKLNGKVVGYRPDQVYLDKVEPIYIELPSWGGAKLQEARKIGDLPKEALQYLAFITQALGVGLFMVTVGPKREQTISW
jgi:adenylosuccinate synthase